MAVSYRAFLIELYEEYLEDAAALYLQRLALLTNPAIAWNKLGAFEDRLEAHIDGLVVGDRLALEVCSRHAAEADFGELFAALCVFCRQDRRDLAMAVLDGLDPGDAGKTSAAADALKYELPAAWVPDMLTLLDRGDPKLAPILARAFGYRRLDCGPQLVSAMKRCAASALPEVVWALGRIAYQPAAEPLLDYLRSEEEPVRPVAALALARMGDSRSVDFCLREARSRRWPVQVLALAGGRSGLGLLREMAADAAENVTALGLLGDPESAPLLLARLEQPDGAAPAAAALECLTGAGLSETVFAPEEVDEDELFESEREALKQGKPLDRGDGRPFGSNVARISQDPRRWREWWRANAHRFTPGVRYRHGSPLSPARLVDLLAAPGTPHEIRRFCGEELTTRYGEDFGFEPDMPAARQAALLSGAVAGAASWGRFQEGVWYSGGRRSD